MVIPRTEAENDEVVDLALKYYDTCDAKSKAADQ